MKPVRILLGDDHSLVLAGIRGVIAGNFEVVGTVNDGKSLVDAAVRLEPDVIILDISMPILNGIDAAREIRRLLPSAKLVFLTMHADPIYLSKALSAGASAYVLKSGASDELLTAIETARKGGSYISSGFSQEVIDTARGPSRKSARATFDLTSRQRQILQLVAEGRQNKEIAEVLHVSVRTVEFHRSRLFAKLGAHTVAELTQFAIANGIIGMPRAAES